MNELQRILCNLLCEVVKALKELDIKYYLTEGSCLGTVRHGGFIPWDDDIDIAIYAEDYESFISNAPRILGRRYSIIGAFEQKRYPNETDMITRVLDLNYDIELSVYKEKKAFHPWIDVSIICGLPNSKIISNMYLWRVYARKAFVKLSNPDYIGFNSSKKRSVLEKVLLFIVRKFDMSLLFNELNQSNKLKKLTMKYKGKEAKYVAAFPSDYRFKELMKGEIYGEGIIKSFEGIHVTIPELYEKYLTILYEDYMKLPPLELRVGKHDFQILKNNAV